MNRISAVLALAFAATLVSCDNQEPAQAAPRQSFQRLVEQFEARTAKLKGAGGTAAVSSDYQEPTDSASAGGIVRVRKETAADPATGRKAAVSLYEVRFVLDHGAWQCREATSRDTEEGKPTGQHSLSGPDVRLENVFVWIGM